MWYSPRILCKALCFLYDIYVYRLLLPRRFHVCSIHSSTVMLNMDKNQSDPIEQVLNLTLEIISLLTGEEYFVVKNPGERVRNNSLQVEERTWKALKDVHIPLPQSVIYEPHNRKKILKLTNKITELLTGEVPIKCQDVTVYFSKEEWEYLEGHKDLYKDVIMENDQNYTSTGLPKDSTNEYPSKRLQPRYGGNLRNPDIYTPKDHIQQIPSHFTEETISCDKINLLGRTQQCPFAHIKEKPVSCNIGILRDQNICTPTTDIHTRKYVFTNIKEEPGSCEGGNFKGRKNTSLDHTQQYPPTHIKDQSVVQDGEPLTIKDPPQQCSSHIQEDPVTYGGRKLIGNAQPSTSTHSKKGINLPDPKAPETQSKANDNIHVQYSCSICKKCFISIKELMSHQEIHIAAKLRHSGTYIFTTAMLCAPQEPPVKHKLLHCSKCERTFYTKLSLMQHMKAHLNKNRLQNKTIKCDQCGKCLSSK